MKDYSLNKKESEDFILGYDVTSDGKIIVKFAKGELFPLPYNEENERILLNKMKEQLKNSSSIEKKLKDILKTNITVGVIVLIFSILPVSLMPEFLNAPVAITMTSILASTSLMPFGIAFKNKLKINDLNKNIRFLEIEKKLNDNVRGENNILVNVSNKTKNVVKNYPEDREVFDINSFNYIPFKDLEQIIDNVDRNERFGFDYTNSKEPHKGIVRKKVR